MKIYTVCRYYDYRKEVEFRLLKSFSERDDAYQYLKNIISNEYPDVLLQEDDDGDEQDETDSMETELRDTIRQKQAKLAELAKLSKDRSGDREHELKILRLKNELEQLEKSLHMLEQVEKLTVKIVKVNDDWVISGDTPAEYVSSEGDNVIMDFGATDMDFRFCIISTELI